MEATQAHTHSFKASESAAAHAQSPSLRQSVEWPCLLGCRLKTHCYGDGAWALSKEAEMTYREVHPSWMAMRGAQPPNNTRAWRALGPFQFEGNCCLWPPTRIFFTSPDNEGQQITIDWTVPVLRDNSLWKRCCNVKLECARQRRNRSTLTCMPMSFLYIASQTIFRWISKNLNIV